jgi:hypothetical protein
MMWWIIGGAILVAVFLFFRGASRFARRQQLGNQLAGQVRLALLTASDSFVEIEEQLWSQRYILGFVQGIVALGVKFYGGPTTTEQRGMVLLDVVKTLRPNDWQSVCDRIISETRLQHPEFALGSEHAANVMGLLTRKLRPEFMADPDVQAAMEEVPQTERLHAAIFGGEPATDAPYATAANNLMMNYMRQFRNGVSLATNL